MAQFHVLHRALRILRRTMAVVGVVFCLLTAALWAGSKLSGAAGYFGPGEAIFFEDGELRRPFAPVRGTTTPTGWVVLPRLCPAPYPERYRLPLWVPLLIVLVPTTLVWKPVVTRLRLTVKPYPAVGPLRPFWRRLKWLSLGFSVLAALACVPSTTAVLRFVSPAAVFNSTDGLWIGNGCVGYLGYVPLNSRPGFVPERTGVSFGRPLEDCNPWIGTTEDYFGVRVCTFPASLLLLAFGVLTLVLIAMDRPIPPGYCPTCGYDLTGNNSGRCPECGLELDAPPPPIVASRAAQELPNQPPGT